MLQRVARRCFHSSINAKQLVFHPSHQLKPKVPHSELGFGRIYTDYMLEIDWEQGKGWNSPVISQYKNLSLSPAASGLHYGIQCFEGMKAYKDQNGKIRLFRPDCNMDRFSDSMRRLSMPPIDKVGLLECIQRLLVIEESWIPQQEGYSVYIRPTAIGSNASLVRDYFLFSFVSLSRLIPARGLFLPLRSRSS